MAILMIALIAGAIGAVGGWFAGRGAKYMGDDRPLKKSEKRVRELEDERDTLLELAYDHKQFDPSFADVVIDEIKKSRKKELG